MNDQLVACAQCGKFVDESVGLPLEDRRPCPNCGSLRRRYFKELAAEVKLTASMRTRFIASAVAGFSAGQIMVHPPHPHDALHPAHHHEDVVGGVFYVAMAGGALVASARRGFRFVKRLL